MSNKKSLLETFKDEISTPQIKKENCALTYTRSCCRGKGYVLKVEKAVIRADLCECVKNCLLCLGQVAKLDDSKNSRPCTSPSPKKIIGIFNSALLPARYIDANLDNFSNFSGNGKEVVLEVKKWLQKFDLQNGLGLSLSGRIGVGKTFLMVAIAKELASRGLSIKFTDFFQLLSEIRAGYSDKKSDLDILEPLLNVDVLILDELGKGRNNDFEQTILDQLVMGRYNAKKPMVISTNYLFRKSESSATFNRNLELDFSKDSSFSDKNFGSLEDRVGERIYSRLVETTKFLELTGNNIRPLLNR